MTTKIIMSYEKPQLPSAGQFQAMLDRFGLGDLVGFEPILRGSEQNVFVFSTAGEFVFRGKPLFAGQFAEEKFVVDHLHRQTVAPVAYPYLVDPSGDLFGWPYALMPRLPGNQVDDPNVQPRLTNGDQEEIACASARVLAQLHEFNVDHPGEYDVATNDMKRFGIPYVEWLFARIRYWMNDARKYSEITPEDERWVEQTLDRSREAFGVPFQPCFVMGDYHLGNAVFSKSNNFWEVSGVFDFSKCYFGDPEADLSLMTASYLEKGARDIAFAFLSAYLSETSVRNGFIQRFSVHMLHERVLAWGLAKATGETAWPETWPFRYWANYYTEFADIAF